MTPKRALLLKKKSVSASTMDSLKNALEFLSVAKIDVAQSSIYSEELRNLSALS